MSNDPLVDLEDLLPQLGPAVEQRRIGEALGRTAQALRGADRQIERFRALVGLAKIVEFRKNQAQDEALDELLDDASDVSDLLIQADDAENLRRISELYEEFGKQLGWVDRLLRTHCGTVMARDFGPLIAIGRLLQTIDRTSDLGQRLVGCGEAACRIASTTDAVAMRDEIAGMYREREALERERASIASDPEVDAFLNALAAQRATLRLVTPKVRDWLEKNGALDNFAVRNLN